MVFIKGAQAPGRIARTREPELAAETAGAYSQCDVIGDAQAQRADLARERGLRKDAEALASEQAAALEVAENALRSMVNGESATPKRPAEVAAPRRLRGNWLR